MKRSLMILGLAILLLAAFIGGYFLVERPKADNMIRVDQPKTGSQVRSPLTITGQARGNWYFEAVFPVVLLDASGAVIAQTQAQAQGDWMTTEFVPFKATLTFPQQPSGTRGSLVVKKDNPSGLPQNDDSRTIPVAF